MDVTNESFFALIVTDHTFYKWFFERKTSAMKWKSLPSECPMTNGFPLWICVRRSRNDAKEKWPVNWLQFAGLNYEKLWSWQTCARRRHSQVSESRQTKTRVIQLRVGGTLDVQGTTNCDFGNLHFIAIIAEQKLWITF